MIREIDGDLIELALDRQFNVITHGCNCFCTMKSGIAPQMAKAFGCNNFPMESESHKGDINKLGTIDFQTIYIPSKRSYLIDNEIGISFESSTIAVVNSYTQYHYGKNHIDGVKYPVDYEAITLCMRKINKIFKGKTIGLPKIGAGLAGGDWDIIKRIIKEELKDMQVTIVHYKK